MTRPRRASDRRRRHGRRHGSSIHIKVKERLGHGVPRPLLARQRRSDVGKRRRTTSSRSQPVLEAGATAERQQRLVESAAAASFQYDTRLGRRRVPQKAFYGRLRRRGLLVYHDLMFAQSGHAPRGTVIERNEIRYQVRRLSSHPCLFLWSGCNECTDLSIYVDLWEWWRQRIRQERSGRRRLQMAGLPASRGSGPARGTGRTLTARDAGTIEAHGPYIRGRRLPGRERRHKLRARGGGV